MKKHSEYPFGYLLTKDKKSIESKIPDGFVIFEEDIVLAYDEAQSFVYDNKEDSFVGILGDIYFIEKSISNQEIVTILTEKLCSSEKEFFKFLKKTLGRFLVIYKKNNLIYTLSDATSMRSVFFTISQPTIISSHPYLLSTEKAEFQFPIKYGYPGNITPLKDVKILTPNMRLDLNSGKINRFYPGIMEYDTTKQTVDDISELLITSSKNVLKEMENRDLKISASLTGGMDSRVTFALLNLANEKNLKKIDFWTYKNKETPNYKMEDIDPDVEVTKILAKKYNLKHTIFDRDKYKNKDFAKKLKDISYYDGLGSVGYGISQNVSSDVELRSNLYEIGRAYYQEYNFIKSIYKKEDVSRSNKLSEAYLAPLLNYSMYKEIYTDKKVEKLYTEFDNFFNDIEFDKVVKYFDELDIFYWEHRIGTWLPHIYLQSDFIFDTNNLINSWIVLESLLKLPLKDRLNASVYKTILEKVDGGGGLLVKLPINPIKEIELDKFKINDNKCKQIANIYYPKRKLLKKDEKEQEHHFQLDNGKFFSLKLEEYSNFIFLESNLKNELILRKSTKTILFCKDNDLNQSREFHYKHKVINSFTLSNGHYLLSTQTEDKKHILLLVDENLKIIKEQKVGLTSWHSQNSIAQNSDGIIMFSEYNVQKEPTKVSIYRSKDMGLTWEEIFFQNFPEEIRHWHTLQVDKENSNYWLTTSGDTSKQSRWFLSKDNGENWIEVTDRQYKNTPIPSKSLSAHRTTCIYDEDGYYYWSTDDLMGATSEYFLEESGERKASSQFYRSKKTEPIHIEKLTNLGIHIRSVVDVVDGFLLFSEGKYATYNTQIFYIDKQDLSKAYFLLSMPFTSDHGGTYSLNSDFKNGSCFIKHRLQKGFGTIKCSYKKIKEQNLNYDIKDYIVFEEHLWFLNKANSLKDIVFSKNSVHLSLLDKKEVFYMLLGDSKVESFQSKELFKVSKNQFGISIDVKSEKFSSVKMYVQFFNDEKKVSSNSYILKNGNNLIGINIKNEEKYLRILFRIEHNRAGKIELSNLSLLNNFIYNNNNLKINQKHKEENSMTLANIHYPKKKLIEKNEQKLKYFFELDEDYLELDVEGILKDKFLYADEKQLIARKRVDTFTISYDSGKTNKYEVKIKGLKIYQVYPLSNGYYLVCGVTHEYKAYVYVFDKDLKEIAKHQQGLMGWHAQDSIDEYNGTLMYVEYQNFEKGAPLPSELTVYRSYDYGVTWEKVFVKSHPDEVRHGHTLQVDSYTGEWLVTFGDTPTQSRWFISKDNGDSWSEITDKTYKMKEFPNRSQCAHRTTSIKIDEDNYYWSTDDFMGNTKDYFTEFNGKRKTSAKIYKASKKQPLVLEEMSNIGIHGRCMIDIGKGYIILTEAKYASFNMQVYYVAKANLSKVYFLFDVYGYKRHSGPASMCSEVMEESYFYTAIARTMFLNSNYQTLKWNFKYHQNASIDAGYDIKDYVRLEEHLWFLDKITSLEDISFFGNGVKLFLNNRKDPFYLLLGDAKSNRLNSKKLFKLDTNQKSGSLNIELEKNELISVKIYIQYFDDNEKVSWESFILKNGINKIDFEIKNNYKYLKVLFRIENKLENKSIVELKNLEFKYIANFSKVKKEQRKVINFEKKDSNISLFFFQINGSSFEKFKPREDTRPYDISYPLDWSVDPFNDRNWCFQLHAWRMMDSLLLAYSKSNDIELLKKCLIIMNDWKYFTFDHGNETDFTWYDMATGLRALKLTYFANLIFNTTLESKIDTNTKNNIIFLLKKHIEVLKVQHIAQNNHGLFQLHGLFMASWLIQDKDGISYAMKRMNEFIFEQFYRDGVHVENSDKYHGFVLDIFKRIVKFSAYKTNQELIEVIDKALYVWKFFVFPNIDPLLIGDTDYKIRNIEFNDEGNTNQYFIKYFKDSGYTFVRSSFSTKAEEASMLFLQTAYQNMIHRHSDDFNILLYEYGKNILVDAGQHSYDRNSDERDYVLSTRAHNTVLIDGHNYDREEKLFYKTVLKTHKEENGIFILQTFLNREDIKVTHGRTIIYKPKEFLVVVDKLTSKQERDYSQYWHFHQDLEVVQNSEIFISNIDESNSMKIECSVFSFDGVMKKVKQNDIDTQLYKGETKPELQGWRSMAYRNLIPNFALRSSIKSKNAILVTKFSFNNITVGIKSMTSEKVELKSDNTDIITVINI